MKTLLPLLSLLTASNASALEVLGVVGAVVTAKPHYESLLSKQPDVTLVNASDRDVNRAKKWSGDYRYDSGLVSGSFNSFVLSDKKTEKLIQPLCLIANDQRSKDWLIRSRSVLIEVKAVCYLVKLDNESDLEALRNHAPGIRVFALDPTVIVSKFGVPFYPALVSTRGVEQ